MAATNQYSAALHYYLQAGAVCSDFFNKMVPPDVYTDQVSYSGIYKNLSLDSLNILILCRDKTVQHTHIPVYVRCYILVHLGIHVLTVLFSFLACYLKAIENLKLLLAESQKAFLLVHRASRAV